MKLTPHGKPWLPDHQLDDLRDQILPAAQPHVARTYETNQGLFLKAQVDHNE